jgi:polysaccharide biosynthesis protein PslH
LRATVWRSFCVRLKYFYVRILCLTNVVPYPPHGGVQLRVLNLFTRIARQHEVTIGCHAWCDEDRDNAAALSYRGIRTVTGALSGANWRRDFIPAAKCLLAGKPPEIVQYQTPELHALVRNECFDILQVEETLLAPYAKSQTGAKTVLTFHNIHFVQSRRIAEIETAGWRRWWVRTNAQLMRRYEPAVARRFDRTIVVSEVDRKLLADAAPGLTVDVVPNGVDSAEMAQLPNPEQNTAADGKPSIVFVGTLHYLPCVDAAERLVLGILPLLRKQIPDLQIWIVGREPSPAVFALARVGVFVEGSVPDVRPYYERAAVAVVPLRAGGGSRLKILEAMALGRPVVSTTVGAEGINVRHGENILLADDDREFAAAILKVMSDDVLRRKLIRNARRLVEEQYDWETIAAAQLRIYDDVMAIS